MVKTLCTSLLLSLLASSALSLLASSALASDTSATITISGYIPNSTEITFDEAALALSSQDSKDPHYTRNQAQELPYQIISNIDFRLDVEHFDLEYKNDYQLGFNHSNDAVVLTSNKKVHSAHIKVSIAAL